MSFVIFPEHKLGISDGTHCAHRVIEPAKLHDQSRLLGQHQREIFMPPSTIELSVNTEGNEKIPDLLKTCVCALLATLGAAKKFALEVATNVPFEYTHTIRYMNPIV